MGIVVLNNLMGNSARNGSAELTTPAFLGRYTSNQGAQTNGTITRTAKSSANHAEFGSWFWATSQKTQGVVYVDPPSSIPTIVGHKYYIRCLINRSYPASLLSSVGTILQGVNASNANVVPVRNNTAPAPMSDGLQTTGTGWILLDSIWTANQAWLLPRAVWQSTANSGNNNLGGSVDNFMVIDLTNDFGAGNEPPLLAIRNAIANIPSAANSGPGWIESSLSVSVATAPVFSTQTVNDGLLGRYYLSQIDLVPDTGTSPFSWSFAGLPQGHGLTINSSGLISGVLSGTINLTEDAYNFTVTVNDAFGYTVSKQFTLNVNEPPVIHDTYIPGAQYNVPYSWTPTITGSDGNLSYTVQVTGGTLPPGLSITDGSIHGTPTIDFQECQITITAYNDYDLTGVHAAFTFGVYSSAIINTTSPIRSGILNQLYSPLTFTASGQTPITWQFLSGILPNGITFDPSTATLSGTPTQTGVFSFSLRAENDLGGENRLFQLTVNELPVITTTTLGYARLDTAYSGQLTATGTTPITYNITSGGLPTGLTLSTSDGSITGTPTAAGIFNFTVVATNAAGQSLPRNLSIEAGLALAIITTSPLRIGTVNVAYGNLQIVAAGVDTSATVAWSWAAQAGSSLPPGLSINATSGIISGTPTTAGTYNFNITINNGGTIATSPFVITIGAVPVITSSTSIGASDHRPFTEVLQASGQTPITWAMTVMPSPSAPGLTLSSNGVLSWLEPEVLSGDYTVYTFTAVATNQFGNSAPVQFSLTVSTPGIIDVSIGYGIVGELYTHTFTAHGALPFVWTFISGTLPNGVTFDPSTATLSGSPTQTGTFYFTLRVDNISGYAQEEFQLIVYQRPVITTAVLNNGRVSEAYNQTLTGTGTTPLSWSIKTPSGSETGLPSGISLSGATISGTPTTQGTYIFTVICQNLLGIDYADEKQFTINIGPSGIPVITSSATWNGIRGTSFTTTLAATGDATIIWSIQGGSTNLPNGLSLSGNIVSGTPLVYGIYQFTVVATNSVGTDTRLITMTIGNPADITTVSLPDGTIGVEYSEYVSANGDTPLSWSVYNSTLPDGLTLNSSIGLISGTPTVAGTYTFNIRVTNAYGTSTVQYSIEIVSVGQSLEGTWIDGKEIAHLFIDGKEVDEGYLNGVLVYKYGI